MHLDLCGLHNKKGNSYVWIGFGVGLIGTILIGIAVIKLIDWTGVWGPMF